jgi:hypothetical protein
VSTDILREETTSRAHEAVVVKGETTMKKTLFEKVEVLALVAVIAGLSALAGCSAHAGYDMGTPGYVVVGD